MLAKTIFLNFRVVTLETPVNCQRPSLDTAFHALFSLPLFCFTDWFCINFSCGCQLGLLQLPVWSLVPAALVLLPHCQILVQTLAQPGASNSCSVAGLASAASLGTLCREVEPGRWQKESEEHGAHAFYRRQNILFSPSIKFKRNLRSLLGKENESVQREERVYGKARGEGA